MTATLPELEQTYRKARLAMIQSRNNRGLTQTEAAKELGVSLTCLNNIIQKEGISWRVIRQGQRKRKPE